MRCLSHVRFTLESGHQTPRLAENCRSSAALVDQVFKGAKPGDLPVQQPVKFEFVINLKSATALGLVIPPSVLLRVDRTVE